METWKKFLPGYEIVILDYSSLNDWIGPNYFDPCLFTCFSLPKQADAVRCAVLKKHGGIWFDIDTIITSSKINKLIKQNADVVLINHYLCFIIAKKNAKILRIWEATIKRNIAFYKKYNSSNAFIKRILGIFIGRYYSRKNASSARNPIRRMCRLIIGRGFSPDELENWDYLGNKIVNSSLRNCR